MKTQNIYSGVLKVDESLLVLACCCHVHLPDTQNILIFCFVIIIYKSTLTFNTVKQRYRHKI